MWYDDMWWYFLNDAIFSQCFNAILEQQNSNKFRYKEFFDSSTLYIFFALWEDAA